MNDITKFDAVVSLVGGELSLPHKGEITYHSGQTPPSDSEIDAEVIRLQAEYDAQEYARNRQAEYPSVQECVHAILDDTLDALQAKRASIKTKYPKGG
jgi:hypothetical protein